MTAGDEHVQVAAQRLGRSDRFVGCVLERLVVVLGKKQRGRHQSTPTSFLSLSTSSPTDLHLDAGLATRRLAGLEHLQPRRDVDAKALRRLLVDRLLLCLHDVGQAGIARLVEAQIGGDNRGRFELYRLQAAVNLARDQEAVALDHHLGGEGALRPGGERSQHLAGLIAIVIDRLLAHDDEAGLLLLDHRLENLGHRQRFERLVGFHQDAAVGAHGQRGANGLGHLTCSDRNDDDLARLALFLEPERLLDGDLVEGVHGHLDVGQLNAAAVALDSNLDVEIDNPLDRHQNFHGSALSRQLPRRRGRPARRRQPNGRRLAVSTEAVNSGLGNAAAGHNPYHGVRNRLETLE